MEDKAFIPYDVIAEGEGLTIREVKQYVKCFLTIDDEQGLPEDSLAALLDVMPRWKKGQHAFDYVGVKRQRFHVLMNDFGVEPKVFGEKTKYYSVVDLDFVNENKKKGGRPLGSNKK